MYGVLAAILGSILLQTPATTFRVAAGPLEDAPTNFAQVGLTIFDLQVNAEGCVLTEDLVYGQPPFIERPRLSFTQWKFQKIPPVGAHFSAIFLFKPRFNFLDDTT